MSSPAVFDSKGPLQLGAALGKGGEGAVYEISGRPELVAKLYHKPIAAEKADKILAMASMSTAQLVKVSAWPTDLLRNSQREPCGLTMPRVSGFKEVHELTGPSSRKIK